MLYLVTIDPDEFNLKFYMNWNINNSKHPFQRDIFHAIKLLNITCMYKISWKSRWILINIHKMWQKARKMVALFEYLLSNYVWMNVSQMKIMGKGVYMDHVFTAVTFIYKCHSSLPKSPMYLLF